MTCDRCFHEFEDHEFTGFGDDLGCLVQWCGCRGFVDTALVNEPRTEENE